MEQQQNPRLVSFDPPEIIPFKLSSSSIESTSYLTIKNLSDLQVSYKLKVSSPDVFFIENASNTIQPFNSTKLKLVYLLSKDKSKPIHKFLVQICPFSETRNWEKNQQIFKFWANFSESDSKPSLESEKQQLLSKNRVLRDKITKNKEKLEESKNLNYLTKEKMGAFGLTELVLLFVFGFILGLLINIFIKSR
jgi:hypothetical protein